MIGLRVEYARLSTGTSPVMEATGMAVVLDFPPCILGAILRTCARAQPYPPPD